MAVIRKELLLVAGSANRRLAEKIAKDLDTKLGDLEVGVFSDGETKVKLNESIRGKDVFVIQSTCPPVNHHLMELLIIIDSVKRASARKVAAVIPYYGYARQEKKIQPREPISARLVANVLETAGADRVLTMDLHAGAIQGFFNVPVDHLTSLTLLIDQMKKLRLPEKKVVVVAPDAGRIAIADTVAKKLNLPLAFLAKRRPEPNVSSIIELIGDVKGKYAVIFEDMVDTGGSLTQGALALKKKGAMGIYALCAHGILSDSAVERIEKSPIDLLVITDSIPFDNSNKTKKIKVISVAHLLAEAIRRGFEDVSISELFKM